MKKRRLSDRAVLLTAAAITAVGNTLGGLITGWTPAARRLKGYRVDAGRFYYQLERG
jgi:hypothetical protein